MGAGIRRARGDELGAVVELIARALAARSAAPLHLETCSQRSVALYECHGWVVTRELALPGGGPLVWTMVSDGAARARMPPVP